MIFTSLKFLNTIPFKQVLIHPVIQTADGKRMSKSKLNAIDPLVMIDKYGADANRFYFTSIGVKGDQDVRFREDRLEEYKRFANKLFNAGRFVLTQLEGFQPGTGIEQSKLSLADRWILHKYNVLLSRVNTAFRRYDFDKASDELYVFTWDYFCDWYLEIAKVQIGQEGDGSDGQTRKVLHKIFEGLMRALHPIMPFITEELWSKLPKSSLFDNLVSIMFAPYPNEDPSGLDEDAEKQMSFLIRCIRAVRNIRQTFGVPASAEAEVIFAVESDDEIAKLLSEGKSYIQRLARANPVSVQTKGKPSVRCAYEAIQSVTIYIPLDKLIDIDKSRDKLQQRRRALQKDIQTVDKTLNDANFQARAPKDKIAGMMEKLAELQNQLTSVDAQLKVLESNN